MLLYLRGLIYLLRVVFVYYYLPNDDTSDKLTWAMLAFGLYVEMTQSLYHIDHASQPDHEPWGYNSQYAPTSGYCGTYATRSSSYGPSPSVVPENGPIPARELRAKYPQTAPGVRVGGGQSLRRGPVDMYPLPNRVASDGQQLVVAKDPEEDLVLVPSASWQLSLEEKL